MNNSIKLEIPLDAETLITTATMLTGLATTLNEAETPLTAIATNSEESLYTSPGTIDEQQAAIAATKLKTIDLDDNDLPWDGRIHSVGKTKLIKNQTWKKKRGLDPAFVLQVENELRQAMAAPPTAEPETAIPPPPATEPLTFPLIMAKITKAMALGKLTNERIKAVVGELGIASIPLLSARPDLIDAANAKLFPNG